MGMQIFFKELLQFPRQMLTAPRPFCASGLISTPSSEVENPKLLGGSGKFGFLGKGLDLYVINPDTTEIRTKQEYSLP
jgi:hypothetical protein